MTNKKTDETDVTVEAPAVATAPTASEPTQPGTEPFTTKVHERKHLKGQQPTQTPNDGVPKRQPGTEDISV